jgi:hypothetical protein
VIYGCFLFSGLLKVFCAQNKNVNKPLKNTKLLNIYIYIYIYPPLSHQYTFSKPKTKMYVLKNTLITYMLTSVTCYVLKNILYFKLFIRAKSYIFIWEKRTELSSFSCMILISKLSSSLSFMILISNFTILNKNSIIMVVFFILLFLPDVPNRI